MYTGPAELPEELAISAITLAELSAGPHQVRSAEAQGAYDEHAERARRPEILQRTENRVRSGAVPVTMPRVPPDEPTDR